MTVGYKVWGRWSGTGLAVILSALAVDQLSKYFVVQVLDLQDLGTLNLTPFMNFTLMWNRGISYSLLQSEAQWGFIAFSLIVSVVLWSRMARVQTRLAAWGLGLVIGGALGNGLDRAVYGAVVDFVHLYWAYFDWYIFNIADVCVVAGVILLLYDGLMAGRKGSSLGNA